MRYFVNGNYSLETLREEFKAYAKKLHPYFGSGNNQEFRELLDEYIAYRRHIQEKYKERYQAEKGRKKPRPTYDPNKKPHHEMKLRNTNKGVYIDGPVEVIFDYRKEIMMHGGTFNPYTKQWEAYTEGGIRELRRWFGYKVEDQHQQPKTDDGTLTLGKLAAMAETGQLFDGEIKTIKIGQFDTFTDFLTTFGAQYYYTLKSIAEGQFNVKDYTALKNFALDISAALGYDIEPTTPDNQKAVQ